MATTIHVRSAAEARTGASSQAYRLLQTVFIVAPTIAGLDKFLHVLVDWDQYLSPAFAGIWPFSAHSMMLVVGAIEMAAGLLVAIRPRIGGAIVGVWLLGIVANLLLLGGYYDVALRDFGLALAAFALSRLAAHEQGELPA